MHDVFISHATEEHVKAEQVAAALRKRGWSVFLASSSLRAGAHFLSTIDTELQACTATVGLWSAEALSRYWVQNECNVAAGLDKLVLARLDRTRLTVDLSGRHALDLSDCTDPTKSKNWPAVAQAVALLIASDAQPTAPEPNMRPASFAEASAPRSPIRRRILAGGSVMLLTALAGLGVVKTITANPLTFELFTDKAGAYRFRLTGEEQQILLKSQGYTSERGARNGIASVRENAMQDERFVPSTASNGMYYFNLKAGNRQIIGTSSHYAEVASRNAAIADVKRWAAQASLAEQTP